MESVNKVVDVKLPDGSDTTSTYTDVLPITGIPEAAKVAHISPNIKYGSLLSVAQLCNYGCEATFTKHTVCITAKGNMVLTGTTSNATGGLWIMDNLPSPQTFQANFAIKLHSGKSHLHSEP
jgi:hypothetical protein